MNDKLDLEEVINPIHWIRILSKIFVILVVIGFFVYLLGFSNYVFDRASSITYDNIWFRQTLEQIKATDKMIVSAKDALKRQTIEDDKRFIRFLGGGETAAHNRHILALEETRAQLILEYNVGRERTDSSLTPQMPPYITILENDTTTSILNTEWLKRTQAEVVELRSQQEKLIIQISELTDRINDRSKVRNLLSGDEKTLESKTSEQQSIKERLDKLLKSLNIYEKNKLQLQKPKEEKK